MLPTSASSKRFMKILLVLGDYPILGDRVRKRMRIEMFDRNIVEPMEFEARVRSMAIGSQEREGLQNPLAEDSQEIWENRLNRIRDHLTVLLFSQNLTFEVFEKILNTELSERGLRTTDLSMAVNLELAPMELVFEYAESIVNLPPLERHRYESRLKESIVVLIRTLISDQLRYIKIAREWLDIKDLAEIRQHKIGAGRIGGKAAGMLLAYHILKKSTSEPLCSAIHMPESYYVGAGELYSFMSINNLEKWNTQKYKSEKQMREDYPQIVRDFQAGSFPEDILEKLRFMIQSVGSKPIIVRSSSLLEDNFGTAFAGKYESIYLPNQGSLEQNLYALTRAMARVYASTLNPSALLYRRSMGLLEYDERMALLIQVVDGEPFGRYYLPHGAGVAFSRNMYRWNPVIRREDGFVRLVWGFGTRAVDRVGNDYPRLIALSHPLLRPAADPKSIRRYSQQFVDLIDLEDNQFKTLPVKNVLQGRYAPMRYLAQFEEDGYFSSLRSTYTGNSSGNLVLTFDGLLQRTPFASYMRDILHILEERYQVPVDTEFTLSLDRTEAGGTDLKLTILQCRPQSHHSGVNVPPIPDNLQKENIIFSSSFMIPDGYISQVDYIVFVSPEGYYSLETENARRMLAQAIGRLNESLTGENFILVGPGRWGSSNSDLGVPISYGDIYHSRMLVEITGEGIGLAPEPSLGTHFFQDLMEAQIYPLAIYLDDKTAVFRKEFFYEAPNCLTDRLPELEVFKDTLRLIHVSEYRDRHYLRIIMDQEKNQAIAFLTDEE